MKKSIKSAKGKKRLPRFALESMIDEANSTLLDQKHFMELVEIAIEALSGRRLSLPPDPERCLRFYKYAAPTALGIGSTSGVEAQDAMAVVQQGFAGTGWCAG